MAQTDNQLRLNKFLAERLGVSRREADELIESKKILIDGQPAKLGAKVDKSNKVCYNNKIVPFETEFSYLAFHKPVGFLCSRRSQGAPTIYELLPKKFSHLKSVGRLDKDSSGLILLTNDGDFAFSMTHPKFRKNKVYEVTLNKPLEPLHQQMITDYGIEIGDGLSRFKVIRVEPETPSFSGRVRPARRPEVVRVPRGGRHGRPALNLALPRSGIPSKEVSQAQYLVFLTEGRNRQIRRTFAALGYTVTKLHRTQFGKYELGNLKPGEYVIIKP